MRAAVSGSISANPARWSSCSVSCAIATGPPYRVTRPRRPGLSAGGRATDLGQSLGRGNRSLAENLGLWSGEVDHRRGGARKLARVDDSSRRAEDPVGDVL